MSVFPRIVKITIVDYLSEEKIFKQLYSKWRFTKKLDEDSDIVTIKINQQSYMHIVPKKGRKFIYKYNDPLPLDAEMVK